MCICVIKLKGFAYIGVQKLFTISFKLNNGWLQLKHKANFCKDLFDVKLRLPTECDRILVQFAMLTEEIKIFCLR